jgi:hypothetical protein
MDEDNTLNYFIYLHKFYLYCDFEFPYIKFYGHLVDLIIDDLN